MEIKGSEDIAEEDNQKSWRRPLLVMAALFIVFIFLLGIIPIYNIQTNPPPDLDKIKNFELTSAEKAKLENISYEHTASIPQAIAQIDVADYRMITDRLVTSSCSSHSDLCYAKAIYYYVQGLQYVSDPDYQYVQSPAETLLSGGGDCEDFSLLYSAMAESIGLDADIGVTNNHAFVRVRASASMWGKEYTWVDPTSNNEFGKVSFTNSDVLDWLEVA